MNSIHNIALKTAQMVMNDFIYQKLIHFVVISGIVLQTNFVMFNVLVLYFSYKTIPKIIHLFSINFMLKQNDVIARKLIFHF